MEWIVLWRRWAPPHNPPKKPTNAAQRATLINFFGLVYWAALLHSFTIDSIIHQLFFHSAHTLFLHPFFFGAQPKKKNWIEGKLREL